MNRSRLALCITMTSLCCATSLAHGVRHTTFEGAVGVEVRYDDTKPMRYSEAKVFSPLDKETEFQQGFTDRNGRFTFFPDATGIWRVVVDDGMGHVVSEDIEIKEGLKLASESAPRFTRFQGVIIGVSVIFGVFGVTSFFLPWRRS